MMLNVASNPSAIGYISLGSLNDTVKALEIDGTVASVENIKNGSYKIARFFNIATKETVSEAVQAFIDYIMSAEGQAVIEKNGYIAVAEDAQPFAGSSVAGKVVMAGSSSVTPVMEKLKEAYLLINPSMEIEVQQSDSSTGIDGAYDIGMASRELKESELEASLIPLVIAMDGIAVIVNNDIAAYIMRTTEEVLLAVPDSYRGSSFGLSAGRLRTTFKVVLPSAVPGILSGVILAIGQIVGGIAALIYIAGTVPEAAESLFHSVRTLSVHMHVISTEGLYLPQSYATAVVLLVAVILINALSSRLAHRLGRSTHEQV